MADRLKSLILVSLLFIGLSHAQLQPSIVESNSGKIAQFYQMEKLALPFDAVIKLATQVVRNRLDYDPNTLAKTYALLADIASIKGESSRAFQLASFGLTYKPIASEVKLDLKLNLASGYFYNSEYEALVEYIEEVVTLAERENNQEYTVIALAYRAMANAFLGAHDKSLEDLLAVEKVIESNEALFNYIELYEILARSQCYLGNSEVALSLYDKILDKRFEANKLVGIESTYAQLAQVYLKDAQLDDAYNAFWESKNYAIQFQLPIRVAYAELGLGKVMIKQQRYEKAFKSLVEAESLFKAQNLNTPYLDTLINLVVASQATGREQFSSSLLLQAEQIAQVTPAAPGLALLYQLLANYYEQNNQPQKAIGFLKQHIVTEKLAMSKKAVIGKQTAHPQREQQSKFQALKVVEINENKNKFSGEIYRQRQHVLMLTGLCLLLMLISVFQWLRFRSQKLNFAYDQNERPEHVLMKPVETKQLYHRVYKKARKYEFPLSVGYIEIKNWSDIVFKYNNKIVNEVAKTFATLINEYVGEFDYAGQINEGEYLLMFPHQSCDESKEKMEKLVEALKVRFFANLGEFSVNIGYSLDAPSVQDIDPYIFLSRLSET